VLETNRHYHQHLDRHDGTPSPLPYTTNSKMLLFQAVIVQMGHDICDRLRDYSTRAAQFFAPLYPNTMLQDHFLHISRVCSDNDKEVIKNNDNYDRRWKMKVLISILILIVSMLHIQTFTVLLNICNWWGDCTFQGNIAFKQSIPKKHKHFRIKIYKLT